MSTTSRQDQDFLRDVLPTSLLESAIEWIRKNLSPEDVFDQKQLETWAEENGYTDEPQ